MKYSNYRLDEFLTDEFFRSWVINPDEESDFFWTSFLENNPDKYSTIIQAKEVILSVKPMSVPEDSLSNEEIDSLFDNILNETKSGIVLQNKKNWGSMVIQSGLLKVAAVIFVIAFVGIFWFLKEQRLNSDISQIAKTIIKETSKGEKMTVRLPDNSVVVLNSNSRLEYPESFSADERLLMLHGEAFFDVYENRERPFIVQSDKFRTEVKGTSFAIFKDPQLNTIDVSVVTGIVEVSHISDNNKTKKVEIEAQQMVSYNVNENDFEKEKLDFDEMIAWKDGTLNFKNANLNDIVQKLENWYGVNITIKKSIDRKKDFSHQYTKESLELVLNGLSFTYDFDYEIDGKEIIIK